MVAAVCLRHLGVFPRHLARLDCLDLILKSVFRRNVFVGGRNAHRGTKM